MTTTVTDVAAIPAIGHREAMAFAEEEARRLLEVIDRLDEADWSRPTDCEGWDVKALLSHVLGAMEGTARVREALRQGRAATRAARRSGRPMIDEMTALQVREHADVVPAEMARRAHAIAASAVTGRRRMPAVVRALPFRPGPPVEGTWKLGYLVDVIMNRDAWMHRVDLTRATGTTLVLSADHDGRLVADVVAEWARTHGQPFDLVLEGPAGGRYRQGEGGEQLRLDAVELCRTLSGRGTGTGLLAHAVPF